MVKGRLVRQKAEVKSWGALTLSKEQINALRTQPGAACVF